MSDCTNELSRKVHEIFEKLIEDMKVLNDAGFNVKRFNPYMDDVNDIINSSGHKQKPTPTSSHRCNIYGKPCL